MADDRDKRRYGPIRRFTRRTGRSLTAISIPYIMLGYPLAGYFIGWFLQRTFGWPSWVPIVVMMMALFEGFREVYRIVKRMAAEEDDNGEDDLS